ncbi:type II secretion system F family protein [Candidatus Poriferisocius sp.]|uniref:type II secretion system F family protein n=1 Tax=Candidatus Poriferisocius sp. TaxID=3101276 RepID=UPI003B023EF8
MALPIALGLLWTAVVVLWGWQARPRRVRSPSPSPTQARSSNRAPAVGLALAAVTALAVHPALGVGVGLVVWIAPHRRKAQQLQRKQAEIIEELPEAIDLLRLAVSSGLNIHLAVAEVGERLPGQVGAGLRGAAGQAHSGMRLADALEALPETVGEPVRPLVRVLIDGDRYGTELEPALEQLAADSRLLRRRRAEEQARRIPVRLLLPLVTCILPAFILLTLAPVIAETLTSLRP